MNDADNNEISDVTERVAYRDKDGTIKFYEEGKAPTYLVRNDSITNVDFGRNFSKNGAREADEVSDHGESYTPSGDTHLNEKLYADDHVVVPQSPSSGIPLPRKRRRDLLPDGLVLKSTDEHSMKAPPLTREDLGSLVTYLTSQATSDLEKVRAFYLWITHNINYDTSGYFGRAPPKPTDPLSVLKTRLAVCEGYCKLFEAFCVKANIPVKIISGYAKAYGYNPGSDVTKDEHNAHAWNAVLLDSDWFLLDVTWGSGYVKSKEKTYVAAFNEAYFLTDPDVFATDHFPSYIKGFEQYESDLRWQLTEEYLSKEEFCSIVNFDKHGKEWSIEPVSHEQAVITGIDYEVDIVLRESYDAISDYVAFLYLDDRKLDQFTYACKPTEETVKIHVCLPTLGLFTLQIYGRREKDGKRSNYQPIVKYMVHCIKAYETVIPYPAHHTVYGPTRDVIKYGVSDIGATYYEVDEGEIILSIKPIANVDIVPKLRFGDHNIDLKNYCFIDFSDCFQYLNIILRLKYEGYFKLELLTVPEDSTHYSTFMTYLLKSTKACRDGIFPVSNLHAVKYKCCILEPLSKFHMPNTDILVCIKSPILTKVRCQGTQFEKTDDVTFVRTIRTPNEGEAFVIEGSANDGIYHSLYTYKASCVTGDLDTF